MKLLPITLILMTIAILNGCATSGPRSPSDPPTHVSPETEPFLRRGIRSFESGNYEDAIANYNDALTIKPDSTVALYELALTYMTMQINADCITTAKKSLRSAGPLEARLATLIGSCHSQDGDFKNSMAAYKRALRLQPNESSAHFNIAITYTKLNNDKKAVHHLQKSIINQPEYSSPYLVLGEVHRRNGHRAQELYMYI